MSPIRWTVLRIGASFCRDRCGRVLISRISREYPAQVSFPKNNDVVQTLAAKRTDKSLSDAILRVSLD